MDGWWSKPKNSACARVRVWTIRDIFFLIWLDIDSKGFKPKKIDVCVHKPQDTDPLSYSNRYGWLRFKPQKCARVCARAHACMCFFSCIKVDGIQKQTEKKNQMHGVKLVRLLELQ